MTMNPSAPNGAASDDTLRAWNERLQQLAREFPKGIANKITPAARRAVLEHIAGELNPGADRGKVFASLCRKAVAQPDTFEDSYDPLEKLNSAARLEFSNGGTQPFVRRRVVKS